METSGNLANPWSTLLVPLVDLTSRNAGSAERWSRTELSWAAEVFVLHLFRAGLTGGNWLFCSSAHRGRYQQSGFLSLRPKNSALSSRFNVNPCGNLKMSPWSSMEHKSFLPYWILPQVWDAQFTSSFKLCCTFSQSAIKSNSAHSALVIKKLGMLSKHTELLL